MQCQLKNNLFSWLGTDPQTFTTSSLSFLPTSANLAGDYDEITDKPSDKESTHIKMATESDTKSFLKNKPMTANDNKSDNSGIHSYYFTLTQVNEKVQLIATS